MPTVLFVCTANRFRSPLAAAIFKQALVEEGRERVASWNIGQPDDWDVASAGLEAVPFQPALPDVLDVAGQLGIDLSAHRSQRVQDLNLLNYDLIVVMQESHRGLLQSTYPGLQERVYLFSQVFDQETYDIPDVYQSPQGVMGVCAVMNDLIRRRLGYICVLAISLHNKRASA